MARSISPYTMTSGDVARTLGLSRERVVQLDDVLQPVRRAGSTHRRYNPRIVEEAMAHRAALAAKAVR